MKKAQDELESGRAEYRSYKACRPRDAHLQACKSEGYVMTNFHDKTGRVRRHQGGDKDVTDGEGHGH